MAAVHFGTGSSGFLEGVSGSESPVGKRGSESAASKLKGSRLRLDALSPTNIPDVGDYGTSVGSADSRVSDVAYGWFEYDDHIDSDLGRSQGSARADHMSVLQKLESMREMNAHTPTSPTPSLVSSPSKTPRSSSGLSSSLRRGKKRILFNLSQKNFTVTTKVFEDYGSSRTYFMALGVGGFRIVQTTAGQHAEYNVIICMNNQTYCIWKRYSHFADLMKDAQLAQSQRHLRKSVSAWEYMESRRKWWRCLDIRYLAQKLSHIEAFLKELVYEIKSPTVLIKFASEVVSPMDGHPTTDQIFLRYHPQPQEEAQRK